MKKQPPKRPPPLPPKKFHNNGRPPAVPGYVSLITLQGRVTLHFSRRGQIVISKPTLETLRTFVLDVSSGKVVDRDYEDVVALAKQYGLLRPGEKVRV